MTQPREHHTAERMRAHAGRWSRMYLTDAAIMFAEGLVQLSRFEFLEAACCFDLSQFYGRLAMEARQHDAEWARAGTLHRKLILVCLSAHFPEGTT